MFFSDSQLGEGSECYGTLLGRDTSGPFCVVCLWLCFLFSANWMVFVNLLSPLSCSDHQGGCKVQQKCQDNDHSGCETANLIAA